MSFSFRMSGASGAGKSVLDREAADAALRPAADGIEQEGENAKDREARLVEDEDDGRIPDQRMQPSRLTKACAAASVSGETVIQLVLSGVSTSSDAAIVRVASSTAMMTATASAIMAISRNRKRIIEALA